MTLTLHEHPFAAYCWKVLIAINERGIAVERNFVGDADDRARLAELWPLASIPVLVDGDLTLPESTAIIERLDVHGDAPAMVPRDAALSARLWDRILDGHVMTPMQKIVGDSLRPDNERDPYGVAAARDQLERAYALLDDHIGDAWITGARFTLADCAAAPALHYARVVHRWDEAALPSLSAYFERLTTRPSVARVIDEARAHRHLFPLPWPEYAA